MVAVPYCKNCNIRVDPMKSVCPKCGGPIRFKIIRKENVAKFGEEDGKRESGYIRPPSA